MHDHQTAAGTAALLLLGPRCGKPCFRPSADLPDGLNKARLVAQRGIVVGHLLLWAQRARTRHHLAALAETAPDHLFDDIGVTRAMFARAAEGWFWEEMNLP